MVRNTKYRLVNAATGTGKTVTYLAPIIHHMQAYDPRIERAEGTYGKDFCFFVDWILNGVGLGMEADFFGFGLLSVGSGADA